MRRLQVAAIALSVMAMTGCPSEFGKDGRITKAVHKDTQEQLIIKRCSAERRKEVCGYGQQTSNACLECGGP